MERKETILVGLLLTVELHSCGTTFPQARNQEASPAPWCHHLTCPGAGPHGPRAAPHHLLPTLPLPCLGLHGFSPCYCCPKLILHLLFSLLGLEMTSQAWKGWAQVGAAGCCCCAPLEHKCSHSSAQQRSVWSLWPLSAWPLQLSGSLEEASAPSASCHGHAHAYIHKAERLFSHASVFGYFHLAVNVLVCLCFLLIL